MQFQVRQQCAGIRRQAAEDRLPVQQLQRLGEAIALAGDGKDIQPQFAQGLEMFPHRRAADAQVAAQLRAGVKTAVAQGLENFEAWTHGGILPAADRYAHEMLENRRGLIAVAHGLRQTSSAQ